MAKGRPPGPLPVKVFASSARLTLPVSLRNPVGYYINYDYSTTTGLPESMTYPTSTSGYQLRVKYDYDHGILNKVSDYNQSSTVFWQLNTVDARGNAIDEKLGNAINVNSGFDPLTGLMDYRILIWK